MDDKRAQKVWGIMSRTPGTYACTAPGAWEALGQGVSRNQGFVVVVMSSGPMKGVGLGIELRAERVQNSAGQIQRPPCRLAATCKRGGDK